MVRTGEENGVAGRLQGKTAIVTGGTSGIGARTVEIFHAEGARVAIAGRTVEKGERLAAALGDGAIFIKTDVAKEADIEALVAQTVERFGRLDCLFNNAGIPGPNEPIAHISWDGYRNTMDVLVGGVMMGMKHAARVMKRQGHGSIINNASVAGQHTGYGDHVYSAAKAAVIHLTRTAAMELGERGIRVNSISPGAILTPVFGKALGLSTSEADASVDKLDAVMRNNQPIRRSGLPEDIAHAAVFLASDEAGFVNGHDLTVDGGLTGGRGWSESAAAMKELVKTLKEG
jgi:NAD(P)-dependent dehydrogenase (short-subunit alcohol dehydrogenase family)